MFDCNAFFSTRLSQETTVPVVHDVGAVTFFVSGIVYTILQSWISYRAYPFGSTIGVCRARFGIAALATVAFIPSILSLKSRTSINSRFSAVLSDTLTHEMAFEQELSFMISRWLSPWCHHHVYKCRPSLNVIFPELIIQLSSVPSLWNKANCTDTKTTRWALFMCISLKLK